MISLILLLLLIASPAFAETYEKVDSKTIRVVTTSEQTLNIDYLKSERQKVLNACQQSVSEYDTLISEALKKGVS